MRRRRRRRGSLAGCRLFPLRGALLGVLLLTPAVARAGSDTPKTPSRLDTDILMGLGAESDWLAQHIELSVKDGVSYRRAFRWRGQNLKLKVWGPVLGSKPGVGLRLRGMRIGELPVEVRAYGTQRRQGFRVDLHF